MRDYFLGQGDEAMASMFHSSSMEYARSLGGDPLCLVTELPLFELKGRLEPHEPGVPSTYLRFKELLPEARLKLEKGANLTELIAMFEPFEIEALDLEVAMRLQLKALDLGLERVGNHA
jgi:hypothetical protein